MKRARRDHLGGVIEHKLGFHLPPDLSLGAWTVLVHRTVRERSTASWKIGDLALHGQRRYGDQYAALMCATGLRYQTIANLRSVAAAFELSRRRENLPIGYHSELMALPQVQQDHLLDQAERHRWSRATLRKKVKEAREGVALDSSRTAAAHTMTPLAQSNESGESEIGLLVRDPGRIRTEVHDAPLSITAIGNDQEISQLHELLRDFGDLQVKYASIMDAVTAGKFREAFAAAERQLFAAENADELVTDAKLPRGLH